MNPPETNLTPPPPASGSFSFIQALGLLVAALLLGLIYNAASPQGIKFTRAPSPGDGRPAPAQPQNVHTGYRNETISFQWEFPPNPSLSPSAGPSLKQVTWAEIKPLLAARKIVLVDARPATVSAAGHIPGALSLPSIAAAAELTAFAAAHPKDTAVVVYCGPTSCHLSEQLAAKLVAEHGFTSVQTMPGGYAEYLAAEPQATSGEPP